MATKTMKKAGGLSMSLRPRPRMVKFFAKHFREEEKKPREITPEVFIEEVDRLARGFREWLNGHVARAVKEAVSKAVARPVAPVTSPVPIQEPKSDGLRVTEGAKEGWGPNKATPTTDMSAAPSLGRSMSPTEYAQYRKAKDRVAARAAKAAKAAKKVKTKGKP